MKSVKITHTLPAASCRTITSEDLATRALKRRRTFPSKAAVLASYGSRLPFKSFDSNVLRQYITHGFRELSGDSLSNCAQPHKADTPSRSLEKPQERLAPSQLSHAAWKYPSHCKQSFHVEIITALHPARGWGVLAVMVLFHALMPATFRAVHRSDCHMQRHPHWTCDWQCGTGLLKAAGHQRRCFWGGVLQAGACRTSNLI